MNRAFFFLSPSFKELSQALHYPPLRPILLAPLLLSFMKSVASFLGRRNKGKGAAKEKHDASTNKQAVFVPKGASYIPTVRTFEASAPQQLSNHKARSQSEDPISSQVASAFVKTSNQLSDASSTCSVVDHEITFSYHPDISQPPLNPVVRKSSRSSSKSAMRGLSRLNLCSPISSTLPRSPTENSPVRPPRPPPLNLHCTTTKRPVNTGISSRFVGNRTVNLTSSPSPCAIKPVELAMKTSGSSSDSSPSLSGSEEEAVCSLCVAASPDGTYICPHQSVRRERHAATNSDPLLQHCEQHEQSWISQIDLYPRVYIRAFRARLQHLICRLILNRKCHLSLLFLSYRLTDKRMTYWTSLSRCSQPRRNHLSL